MRKKSLEELRAGNAARQARWRAKHRWLAEQRRLALYGKSNADKVVGIDREATSLEELRYEEMALVEGDPETVRANARVVAKRTGRAIPVGLMEPEVGGGRGSFKSMGATDERRVGAPDSGGGEAKTAEEKRVRTDLKEARQAKGELGKGFARRGTAMGDSPEYTGRPQNSNSSEACGENLTLKGAGVPGSIPRRGVVVEIVA